MPENGSLLPLLKEHFGFDSFLPLQEEIIRDSLAGRDVFALLPTGGGKSLCFQLPALARPGLTVVVSPLIALMKDQVDALTAAGIAATFLNSSLDVREMQTRGRALNAGEYRLLYVAPERVMMSGFVAAMEREADRGGRGALRERMGARLPAGVPAVGGAEGAVPERTTDGANGDGDRAGARRHRPLPEATRASLSRGKLQPCKPYVPGPAQAESVLTSPGVRAGAAK